MKVYTKTGDLGETSLLSGERVPKYNKRIEAYGTTDELNSFVGLLRSYNIDKETKETLIVIQNNLFNLGAQLSLTKEVKFKIPDIIEEDIIFLEKEIDKMNESLPPIKNFVLPGGGTEESTCHICRTICRRNERQVVQLSKEENINPLMVQYLNRLSDYFFVLSRKLTIYFNNKEIMWKK